ncbi:MAG: hypothetical protein LBV34_21720 [Nocardiopsaceae bacterium]|nr:hypothetical protein [Nocardiopsaceae bacterium]
MSPLITRVALAGARFVATAGLAVDAYVHFDLAGTYSETGGVISEGVLFRAEAVVALLAALFILIIGKRASYLAGLVIAGSALAAMLVARYVDVGAIGPFPDVYDPVWFPEKVLAAIGEGAAMLAAIAGIALLWKTRGRTAGPGEAAGQNGERSADPGRSDWRERTKEREGRRS